MGGIVFVIFGEGEGACVGESEGVYFGEGKGTHIGEGERICMCVGEGEAHAVVRVSGCTLG